MQFLNSLKITTNFLRESLDYIKIYQIIYNTVIKEDKKRETDNYVLKAKNITKAMWQIINEEVGNCMHYDYRIDLRNGSEIISNPQNLRLNFVVVESVNDLLNQYNSRSHVYTLQ